MTEPTGQNPSWPGPHDGQPLPPGQMPPYQPPGAPYGYGMQPEPPKKKKWPWILGGVFVLCFLPLGACVALVGLGVNAIGDVEDRLNGKVEAMFADARQGNFVAGASGADASGGCVDFDELAAQLEEIAPNGPASIDSTVFVQRGDGLELSNNTTEASDLVVDNRTESGAARVTGTIPTATGTRAFEVLLIEDVVWTVCSVSVS